MLILNEQQLAEHDRTAKAEQERDKTAKWLRKQLETAVYIENSGNDPTNFEKRMGRALPVGEVEKRLKRLIPQLEFEHTINPFKKYLIFVKPDGTREKLMVYESGRAGLIPEHSIMQPVIKEDLDPAVVESRFHLDRKDLPKHEIRPHEFNKETGELKKLGGVEFDDREALPGMKRTRTAWSEAIRGYRTMAAFLVASGYLTPTQAEAAFGNSNTPEWASKMGRRGSETPW